MPGHVCAVSGYLGTERLRRGTSMREVFHMSAEQLRFLIERGWTVSSHSHTHCPTKQAGIDLDLEVRISKEELEKATGQPVRLFTLWNDLSLATQIAPLVKQAGYLGILSVGYPFNPPEYDVWSINRGTVGRDLEGWLSERRVAIFHHTADAFPGRLTRDKTQGCWLVDVTHIVADRLPKACPASLWNRCSTPSIIAARFREIRELWGDDLWAAVPEDVVEYTMLRRATQLITELTMPERIVCRLHVDPLPALACRELSFCATLPWPGASVNNGAVPVTVKAGKLVFTMPVCDEATFELTPR